MKKVTNYSDLPTDIASTLLLLVHFHRAVRYLVSLQLRNLFQSLILSPPRGLPLLATTKNIVQFQFPLLT